VFADGGCFWGGSRVRAAEGRAGGGFGHSGGGQDGPLRGRGHGPHRPRRVGARHLRCVPRELRDHPEGVLLRGPRPHPAQLPGAGLRHPVPLGDLLRRCGAEACGGGVHPLAGQGPGVRQEGRHAALAAGGLLPCRGLPPGLPAAASHAALHHDVGPAQDRRPGKGVPEASRGGAARQRSAA
jgi:hypothetical protein